MYFSFSDEQTQFREVIRRFLRDRSPTDEVRRLMADTRGYDEAVWRAACDDVGLGGLPIPEACGGLGFGAEELGIALEEMGRALYCAPYFSSIVLAAQAITNGATEQAKQALLPDLAAGRLTASLAITEADGAWEPGNVSLTAAAGADGYVLNGEKMFVIDGASADKLIVVARDPGTHGECGLSLLLVDGDAVGVTRHALEVLDPTRKQARITFNNVVGELIGEHGAAAAGLERTLDQARVALAHEMVGGAAALLEAAVDYAKMRMQFGRLIGSFQAIKHKLADLLLQVENAKSAAYYAAAAIDADDKEMPALAALAKAVASDTYRITAAECIQVHGGIGFTWDHDTHLWYKRAKSSEVFLGTPAWLRERYIQLLEGAP